MYPFEMKSSWHSAKVEIPSFVKEELFGTKLRALLQRRKNRDLFDLNQGLLQLQLDTESMLACFAHYLELEELAVSRAEAEERMLKKLNQSLTEDIAPLLPAGVRFSEEDAIEAFNRIWKGLIEKLQGEPWKSSKIVVEELRKNGFTTLLKDDEVSGTRTG